ncbi:hypothetical protein B0J13DRAFT_507053 [Dactylonectria estremocensis]|uniref:Choline monooxygenase, chloroplastic n=1 Tax=Dactylonectria estremocensis TaxID=1079267 RepID=A0A9P9IT88_9HYPO|nr:hypothetical protein B0J13DRAFT_507053 [Dactylonectria estremocensis]
MPACPTTLPASWYTSNAFYCGLERRAVFLQAWMLLGAVARWPNVGEDYPSDIAQVEFTVRRISDDWRSIKVFLNADGTEMKSHLTSNGLLFLTLSNDSVDFEEYFPGLEDLVSNIDCTQLTPRRCLTYPGSYNWKTMVDGYQECLHCAYVHPAFSKIYSPVTYQVLINHNYCQHIAESSKPNDGLFIYMFPNSTIALYGGGMSSFRACPQADANRTIMQFDYYHQEPVGSEIFENYYKFARKVAEEDHELCEKAQVNLEVGIYSEGLLNPDKENGVAYYQNRVREMCCAEYRKGARNGQNHAPLDSSPLETTQTVIEPTLA